MVNPPENDRPDHEHDDDTRWLVVAGRRWRRTDPELPDELTVALRSHLGSARATAGSASRRGDDAGVGAARRRVGLAKQGLGERGPKWWEEPLEARLERARSALRQLEESSGS